VHSDFPKASYLQVPSQNVMTSGWLPPFVICNSVYAAESLLSVQFEYPLFVLSLSAIRYRAAWNIQKLYINVIWCDFPVSVVSEELFSDINVPLSCDIALNVLILRKWDMTGGGARLFVASTKVRPHIHCVSNWNLRLRYSVSQL
jgi:hypothetical protein